MLGYLRLRMPDKKRCNTINEMTLYDSREMNYGSDFRNQTSALNQGEDEEVADGLSDISSRFPKGWISTIMLTR